MSHILLLEVPGGTDFKILEEAVRLGHDVTFFTSDLDFYLTQKNGNAAALEQAAAIVTVSPFSYEAFEKSVLAIHAGTPFDAVLCLIDIRLIEASRIAAKLGLPFLNLQTTRLLRDKYRVRAHLARRGIRQPRFALATSNEEIRTAIDQLGFPVLVKPSDGYGSQNIVTFTSEADLNPLIDPLSDYLPSRSDYGLGVMANDRLVVEEFIQGTVIGCETITVNSKHHFLGITEKQLFPAPSFAIRGSCFPSDRFDIAAIKAYLFGILDALNFDFGATHTEMIVTKEGIPYLVEVNPRLVGAQIPLLLGLALDRSVYADVVNLHLGHAMAELESLKPKFFAVSRWLTANKRGMIESITPSPINDDRIRQVQILKSTGARVSPPFHNGDRLGFVMAAGSDRKGTEKAADDFIAATRIRIAA
jgi:biotin carboxylase